MTIDDIRADAMLGALPLQDITPPRAQRLRERCHDALATHRPTTWRPLEVTILTALCGTYLLEVASRAITLLR